MVFSKVRNMKNIKRLKKAIHKHRSNIRYLNKILIPQLNKIKYLKTA